MPHYAKIKDRYCIAYFGSCNEYIVQLRLLRPIMERTFPGVQVYLACKDELLNTLLKNEERTLGREDLRTRRKDFAYVRELVCDGQSHPVEEFMRESGMPLGPVPNKGWPRDGFGNCVIYPQAFFPSKSLTDEQIRKIMDMARKQEYEPRVNGPIEDAEWVIGPENEQVFEAAAQGYKTTLVATGIGENLFKSMFPHNGVVRI